MSTFRYYGGLVACAFGLVLLGIVIVSAVAGWGLGDDW
jgi:hypothetical protein